MRGGKVLVLFVCWTLPRKTMRYLSIALFLVAACPRPAPPAAQPTAETALTPKEPQDSVCTATFTLDTYSWKAKNGCWADRTAFNSPGILVYPCEGSGEATATFGPYRFTGTINKKKRVKLAYQSESVLAGSCSGVSIQQLTGRIGGDFLLQYDEIPDEYGCAKPCSASATLRYEGKDQ